MYKKMITKLTYIFHEADQAASEAEEL